MKNALIILLLSKSILVSAQTNLVPNPSFEELETCPFDGSQLFLAEPWFTADGSPDLYNTCATIWNWDVPENQFGYQDAHTGDGYAGGVFFNTPDNREFLEVELDSTLIADQLYAVSFYVSLSSSIYCGSNNVAMHFANSSIIGDIPTMSLDPQINETTIISDTEEWTLIEGEFTAEGGEKFIIIGNFLPRAMTDTVHLPETAAPASYFYVDDVNVSRMIEDDQSSIPTESFTPIISLSPNPITQQGSLIFADNQQNTNIYIFNTIGQEVYHTQFNGTTFLINKADLGSGSFFISIDHATSGIINKKFIIE